MLTDTSGPAAGSCGAWSGERRPSARPAVGHDPPPALRAAASASAARSAASCSSSSPGTPSPATRTAPNQQKMRDMGELRGPWRAAAERARPCRTPRGSSAPRAASPTGSPAVSPSKPPFSCTSPGPRRARTAGAWPRRAARPCALGARAGPSPPWAPRRRRSARLVAADRAKQLFAKPNCTSTYGTSSSRGERRRLPRELFLCTP